MRYTVRHETIYSYTDPVPICHNRVHLVPRTTPYQACQGHELEVYPKPISMTRRNDYFGNATDYFSIQEAHEELRITANSVVEVIPREVPKAAKTAEWEQVAAGLRLDRSEQGLAIFHYSLPSPRIVPSDSLRIFAAESFSKRRPVFDGARELTQRVRPGFPFDPRATTVHTSPAEFFELRRGVCQDFAHFAVSCLRSIGLAARYVSGYVRTIPPNDGPRLVGADASHAWVSVYCGAAGWIDFDPTNDVLVGESHITIAWGRDYGDVGPIQGVFVGGGEHTMHVGVDVAPLEAIA